MPCLCMVSAFLCDVMCYVKKRREQCRQSEREMQAIRERDAGNQERREGYYALSRLVMIAVAAGIGGWVYREVQARRLVGMG